MIQLVKKVECPYKDASPENTINHIRNILTKHKIFTTEENWISNMERLFSCSVKLEGLNVVTNGKGLTKKYALASAYGEFMERLQNHILYAGFEFSREDKEKYGFKLAPDEKKIVATELKTEQLPESFSMAKPFTSVESLTTFWESYVHKLEPDYKVLFIPYFDVFTHNTTDLPYYFLRNIYGSNGMCAGNTKQESIIQGLSEILERYVVRELYFKNITPPVIPEEYMQKHFPKEYSLIQMIEKTGQFKVIVRDCSLNQNIPVIGLAFFDFKSNTCFTRFGAEPDIKIALQRCITELFQGMRLTGLEKMLPFSLDNYDLHNDYSNYNKIHFTGKGRFVNSFFLNKPAYPFQGFPELHFSNMQDKLDHLIHLVQMLGYNHIYIRDFSFLNFPTHQIIIPGLSEAFSITPSTKDLFWQSKSKVYLLSNLSHLDHIDLTSLTKSIENFKNYEKSGEKHIFINHYFKNPIKNETWDNITLEFLLSLIYYKLGNIEKAYENITIFIELLQEIKQENGIQYYYCIQSYFALLLQNISKNEIKACLNLNYQSYIVDSVIADLADKSKLFQYLPLPANWNCTNCSLEKGCHYDKLKSLYLKLKKAQLENPVDQMKLNEVFHKYSLLK